MLGFTLDGWWDGVSPVDTQSLKENQVSVIRRDNDGWISRRHKKIWMSFRRKDTEMAGGCVCSIWLVVSDASQRFKSLRMPLHTFNVHSLLIFNIVHTYGQHCRCLSALPLTHFCAPTCKTAFMEVIALLMTSKSKHLISSSGLIPGLLNPMKAVRLDEGFFWYTAFLFSFCLITQWNLCFCSLEVRLN